MIASLISDLYRQIGHTWKTKSGTYRAVGEEDVRQALDTAAAKLYPRGVGDQFSVGGIIVEKTEDGLDVYAYIGTYS